MILPCLSILHLVARPLLSYMLTLFVTFLGLRSLPLPRLLSVSRKVHSWSSDRSSLTDQRTVEMPMELNLNLHLLSFDGEPLADPLLLHCWEAWPFQSACFCYHSAPI
jgi:hypothetical protein